MKTVSTRDSTNMIEELDKISELEASKQADLEKKRASSTDENNLPRGKPSLSVIAARAAKKKEGNDLPGGETSDSENLESPPKKKTGDQIDMSPMTLEEIIELREMETEIRKEIRKEKRIEDKEIQKHDDEIERLYSKYQIEMVTVRDQLESTCFLDDVFLANISTVFTAKYNALDVEHKIKYNNNLLDRVIIAKTVPGTVVIRTKLRDPNNPLLKFTQIFSTGVLSTNFFKDRTN